MQNGGRMFEKRNKEEEDKFFITSSKFSVAGGCFGKYHFGLTLARNYHFRLSRWHNPVRASLRPRMNNAIGYASAA
jgi:hypothetical protein